VFTATAEMNTYRLDYFVSLVNAPDFITSLMIYLTSYHLEPSDVKISISYCFLIMEMQILAFILQ